SVAVKGGRIVAVGPTGEIDSAYIAREAIDARGKVVVPGLINGHTHIPMTLFRGLADDLDLNEWLTKYIFPAEAKNVSEEFVRAGTRLGLAEMIRGGTTTYCDMYYFEDAIAEETFRAGVRGVLGETVIDFPVADNKTWAEAMAYSEKFVRKWKGNKLIVPAIAPHAPYTVSEEHLKEVRAFSDRTGAPVVTHVSETRKEVEDLTKSKGASPVDYLERIGFLSERVIAAHMVHPGKRADLIIVDLDDLNQTPLYNIYSHLVYATKADDVRTVVIEGRVIMRDRRLLTLDEKDIKARARVFREQIIKSLAPSSTQTGKNSTGGLAPSPSNRP
ncbi:MAG: amidohydrolase family protein, partial [Acidobacteria bacterium]|nr:amidohydrolase family protein [Acidobacteriota bacterium]